MNPPPVESVPIDGLCDDRFAAVREVFAKTFDIPTEPNGSELTGSTFARQHGAAVCVMVGSSVVIDLWGGFADNAALTPNPRPWQRDTLVNAFSVGKAVITILALSCVEAGELDLDAPVASLWPEFAANGKDKLTVRSMLAHRSGLPAVRKPLGEGAMYDWGLMCDELAAQRPFWEPDTAHGYHVNTQGYLVGEVLRRCTGVEVGRLLQERLAGPLGAEYYFGLPTELHKKVSHVFLADVLMRTPEEQALAFAPSGDAAHDEMLNRVYFNPPGLSGLGTVNQTEWKSAVIPSTNGHGNARGIAALHAAYLGVLSCGGGGPWPGVGLRDQAAQIHSVGVDRVLGKQSTFGLGFQLPQQGRPFTPGGTGYGHYGFGGSLALVDPTRELSFAFVTNSPGQRGQNQKADALVEAVCQCL